MIIFGDFILIVDVDFFFLGRIIERDEDDYDEDE